MKTLISTLEDNIFLGVLIKKGVNKIPDKIYNNLISNPVFRARMTLGQIKEQGQKTKSAAKTAETIQQTTDFDSMSYDELKKYVKENNIKTDSMKKADILKALKQL